MTHLHFYNTLTKKKEIFIPLEEGKVKIYNCGPTVYDYATIGNFRTYVFNDIIVRTLKYFGYKVTFVRNYTDAGHMTMTDAQKAKLKAKGVEVENTDVDSGGIDRIAKAMQREGWKTPKEVTDFYITEFEKDARKINLTEPDFKPRVTDHIEEQIAMIKTLIEKGYAYVTKSAVYFDTSKFKRYGQLSGQNLNEKIEGFRNDVIVDKNKRNPADFRLWQLDDPTQVQLWDSPWGVGFPGWHIECSAMSKKYLGEQIDIHTGGVDLIPVHHENEIAQSESCNNKKFVNYWMHGEFITVDGKRMGKSLGNAYTITDLEKLGFSALDLRYFYFTVHYRTKANFTIKALEAAKRARSSIIDAVQDAFIAGKMYHKNTKLITIKTHPYAEKFRKLLADDLAMPQVIALVWQLLNDKTVTGSDKVTLLLSFDEVLAIGITETVNRIKSLGENKVAEIESLIKKREQHRANREWEESDKLRDKLAEEGILLEDSKEGTKWKII